MLFYTKYINRNIVKKKLLTAYDPKNERVPSDKIYKYFVNK